ncbi:MAG: uL22 family ribosomal protein [Candidatus Pacearchaeota archaeon]
MTEKIAKEGRREKEEKKNKGKEAAEKEEKIEKKEVVIAKAFDLPISKKAAVAICKVIKGKSPFSAIQLMEKVIAKKVAIPLLGEVGHRKRGHRISKLMSGRYPEKAARYFIKLLRQAIANARQANFDDEKMFISLAKANKGSTQFRPGRFYGRRFKRTHVYLEIREK